MNHYPKHIGDFIRDTVGLTLAERGAYTALLDTYYATEKPIQYSERYRICGCRSRFDSAAVDYVMAKYFFETPDGWRNKRADKEIDLYKEKSSKASASAQFRWSERNANAMRTHSEGNASHKPVTSNQEESKSKAMSSSPETPANIDVLQHPVLGPKSQRRDQAKEVLAFLNMKTGRSYRQVDANLIPIMARLNEGATMREFRAVIARKCREWIGDERMEPYLRPATLFNATKFAQYVGEVPPESEVENG